MRLRLAPKPTPLTKAPPAPTWTAACARATSARASPMARLQGEHQLTERLSASWSLVYSRATNNVPDVAEQDLKLTSAGNRYQDISRIWLDNTDQDKAAYLNLKYQLAEGLELGAGGLYRAKDRANRYLSYPSCAPRAKRLKMSRISIRKPTRCSTPRAFMWATTTTPLPKK